MKVETIVPKEWNDKKFAELKLDGETLEAVANDLGCTRERIRQIDNKARYKIIKRIEKQIK